MRHLGWVIWELSVCGVQGEGHGRCGRTPGAGASGSVWSCRTGEGRRETPLPGHLCKKVVNLGQGNNRCYRDSVLHDG